MRFLSGDELGIVWEWCEENGNPISEAYLQACAIVGMIMPEEGEFSSEFDRYVYDKLPSKRGIHDKIYSCHSRALKMRDYLGSIILQIINDNAKDA